MHWTDGMLAGLDLETDNADPGEAYVVTAAVGHRRSHAELDCRSWVARPRRPIPDEAAAVHGYPTERAETEGTDPATVLAGIRDALAEHWTPECPLVVYNSPFDLTIIDRELGRLLGESLEIGDRAVVDPLLIDRQADRWRKGERKLEITCQHYGIALDAAAHDARVDVVATMHLAYAMGRRRRWPRGAYAPSVSEMRARRLLEHEDPRVLHAAQVRWFHEQALGLASYFRTPKAVDKIWRDHGEGKTTRERAEELISTLAERADDAERHAGGWPMRVRQPVP